MICEQPVGNSLGIFLVDLIARMLAKSDETPFELVTGSEPPTPDDPGAAAEEPIEPETRIITRVRHSDRLNGLDAAHYQGKIAWRRVMEDGNSFAIIKSSEGGTDSKGRGFVDKIDRFVG